MKKPKSNRIVFVIAAIFLLISLVGCGTTEAPKYPAVLDAINAARSQLGNDTVFESSDADVYAARLSAMYVDSGYSNDFNSIAKSYIEDTYVNGHSWKAYHCVRTYGTTPSSYLSSYIATRSDITRVGISVVTNGSVSFTVIVGY